MKKWLVGLFSVGILFSGNAQWEQTNGPFAGNLNEIIELENTLFLSTYSGGIFKSTDDGLSWSGVNSGLPTDGDSAAVDLVADGGILYSSFTNKGVFKSEDLGETWTPANAGIDFLTIWSLFIDDGIIYGASDFGGIYVSEDQGQSWVFREDNIPDSFRFNQFLTFQNKLYGFKNSLYESSDQGVTWLEVDLPFLGPNGVDGMIVKDDIFYLVTRGRVYTSSDYLVSWQEKVNLNTGTDVRFHEYNDFVHLNGGSGDSYYRTEDNGENWIEIENNNFRAKNIDYFVRGELALMTTVDSQLWRSIDGGVNWSVSTEGIIAGGASSILELNGELLAGVPNAGIFKSTDSGGSWVLKSEDFVAFNSWVVNDIIEIDGDLFIGTGGGLYVSNDIGENWEQILLPPVNESFYRIDFDEGNLIACSNTNIFYISPDLGETWQEKEILDENDRKTVFSTAIQGNTVFVGTFDGTLLKSSDLGDNWDELTLPTEVFFIREIILVDENLIVATPSGAFLSKDLGETWVAFENNNHFFLSITVKDDLIYAGTLDGFYVSSIERLSWTSFQDGLPNQIISGIGIGEESVFLSSGGAGIWKRPLNQVFIPPLDDDEDGVPNNEDLCPNTESGTIVNNEGCDFIGLERIRVLALTPSCTDSTDGSIEISMDETNYELNVVVAGPSETLNFENISSSETFKIRNLNIGLYEITISIPDIFFERTFGVTINQLDALTGKRIAKYSNKATYMVGGSAFYTVVVNGNSFEYNFSDTSERLIEVKGVKGSNRILIKGMSDCQGFISDTVDFENAIDVFSTVVNDEITIAAQEKPYSVRILNTAGRLIKYIDNIDSYKTEFRIDATSLRSGLYFIQLNSSDINQSIKVIKQ